MKGENVVDDTSKKTNLFEVFLGFIGLITILFALYIVIFHYLLGLNLIRINLNFLYNLGLLKEDSINKQVMLIEKDTDSDVSLNKLSETQPTSIVNIKHTEGPYYKTENVPKSSTVKVVNKAPIVEMLYYHLSPEYSQGEIDQFNLVNSDHIPLYAKASDPDGEIRKVEIYVDEKKLNDIYPYDIGGTRTQWTHNKSISKINTDIEEWLNDKSGETVLGTMFYIGKSWDSGNDCGVSRGYANIIVTEQNVYDIRTPRDLEESVICNSGKTMNYVDTYVAIWNNIKKGEHYVYAIAYDNKGDSTKSDVIKIKSRE